MATQDVTCPHCGRETTLFLPQVSIENPGTTAPAKNDETKTETPDTTKVLFLIIGFAAVLIPLAFFIHYYKNLAIQQENYAEAMGMGADQEERKTKRMNEQADAARKLAIEIANLHKHEPEPIKAAQDGTPYIPPPPTPEEFAAAIDKANAERVKRHAEEARTNAVRWLQTQATNGDVSAQYRLALHFLTGDGCATNRAEAVRWFKIAAAGGSDEASNKLATLKP
jgi:hypothetical protein